MRRLGGWIVALAALWAGLAAPAWAARDGARVYVFGNSLIHHLTDSDQTTMPHWLALLAREGGRDLALSGQWALMRNMPEELPAAPDWKLAEVTPAWNGRGAFSRGAFDTLMLNPANYIQSRPPDAPYEGQNPQDLTPVAAALQAIDWATERQPGLRVVLYEGWADMAGFTGDFPPWFWQLRRWHAWNTGESHVWYETWAEALRAARPDLRIDLVPVGSVLSRLLTEGPLADVPVEALFTDDAPHGTATTYLLAAMITYAGLFEAPLPAGFVPPQSVHPALREGYGPVADRIAALLLDAQDARAAPAGSDGSGSETVVRATAPAPETPQPSEPRLAMGLAGISDWATQQPFIDRMKTARPWIGHKPGQWGGFTPEDLRAGGYLDEHGWPRAIPEGAERLDALVLTEQPEAAGSLAGTYVLRWKGTGDLQVAGRSRLVSHRPGEIVFNYTPGDGMVAVRVYSTDPEGTGDHVRDITLVRRDQEALHEAGALFNPLWIEKVSDLRALRFMDWMDTNGSKLVEWQDRPRVSDATYGWRGVPLEVMLALANEVGADPWFTLPHMADDDHVRRFAEMVRDGLDPRLVAYVEWSNEVWNGIFPQADWARQQAAARWGDAAGGDAWMQLAGARAAEVMRIWTEAFDAQAATRLQRVVAVHTGWPGLEEPLLTAPLWVAEEPGRRPPADWFDAYAVTGYVGYELGRDDWAPKILQWLEKDGRDAAVARAAQVISEGSMVERAGRQWAHHAEAAGRHGLDLVMYEGGTHVVGHGPWSRNETLTAFFHHFNYSDEMGEIHRELLTRWRAAGGTLFNAFVDVWNPSRWGSWGALRHLDDDTPRWRALMAYNDSAPGWGPPRAPGTFAHGVTRFAPEAGGRLEGAPEEDSLIGGPGDDVLVSAGGADRLHGGPGRDAAVLPGGAGDYLFTRDGDAVLAAGPAHVTRLVAVEEIRFEADPGLTFLTASVE